MKVPASVDTALQEVALQQARPLTVQGGEFHVDDELRSVLCYLDDGRLLVEKSHAFSAGVRAFVVRLKRLNRQHSIQYVDLAAIAQVYRDAKRIAIVSASKTQAEVLDLFTRAVALHASDIHFRVSQDTGVRVFFRIHNDLEEVERWPYAYGAQMCATIYQAMADVSDATFEPLSRQDARIADRTKIPAGVDGIRVATSPQVGGYLMVLRLLYNDAVDAEGLQGLGYGEQQRGALQIMARSPNGINVIGGPTGSGKSTTLQRLLTALIRECDGRKHVITVEDPPEYPIPDAVQTPVTNAETEEERSKTFQSAIKAAMRLDPDVIMIGEVRDSPSARLAVQAAMSGHQVWSTVHATSAFAIVDRLHELGVSMHLATDPSVITGLACQRLVKILCPHCKEPLASGMKRYREGDVRRVLGVVPVEGVYVRGEGCERCRNTGTSGRTVVAEVVLTDSEIMACLRRNERDQAITAWRRNQAGITMMEDAIQKVREGLVDPFQAEAVVGPLDLAGARHG